MIPRTKARRTHGFTIIEVLVAMLLFAIVTLVILAPLTGLFGLTQRSTQQVTATNLAQQALEEIRGEWLTSGQYSRACVNTLPSSVNPLTVTAQDKDIDGNVLKDGSGNPVAPYSLTVGSCSTAAPTTRQPAIRAVTVQATVSGSSSTLNLEIARP